MTLKKRNIALDELDVAVDVLSRQTDDKVCPWCGGTLVWFQELKVYNCRLCDETLPKYFEHKGVLGIEGNGLLNTGKTKPERPIILRNDRRR